MARFFQPKKKLQPESKHQQVVVEKLDHQGAGMAFLNNKPLFIDGTLPGEEVVVQLVESKSKFSRGKLIKLLKPSLERVAPFCPHFNQCGGCDMQHMGYSAQLSYKQQTLKQLMKKFAGREIELAAPISGLEKGYRRRARISLLWDKKQRVLQFGFRRKQSKQIETVTQCPVLAPQLETLLPELKQCLSGFARPEVLGHVELVLADNGVVMTLRHTAPLSEPDQAALRQFAEQHQAILYLMPASDELHRLVGEAPYYQEVGVKVPFEPNHFIQVNQQVNQQMVAQALEWLDPQADEHVLDLFCGLGNFSLPIARKAKSVIGVEGVAEMVHKATINAALNQINNAQFFHANLEQDFVGQPWASEQFDKIVLDPARAGASGIIDKVSALGAKRVVYVSCNPATLARDSQSLLDQGYRLTQLGMLDMFPYTSHLESMALFEK